MIYINFLALAMVISEGLVVAQNDFFGDGSSTGNQFIAPDLEDDDVRSPCPAINTLANHGFINRDGKGIQVDALAMALEDVYGVSAALLRGGPVQASIDSGLTEGPCDEIGNGQCTLNIDRLFETEEALEHDSSLIREDNGQFNVDDQFPSPSLLASLFDRRGRSFLTRREIMDYQRNRIEDSCETRGDETREYTGEHLGGMSIQGALVFILAQSFLERPNDPFSRLEKAKLRSILEDETLPEDYVIGGGTVFTFADGTEADDVRDEFRDSVELAIAEFCE